MAAAVLACQGSFAFATQRRSKIQEDELKRAHVALQINVTHKQK